MVDKQDEWLFPVAAFHPLDGFVRDDVGAVSLFHAACPVVVDEGGVVVFALAREYVVVVEARGFAHEVPFADDGRLVAGLLQ